MKVKGMVFALASTCMLLSGCSALHKIENEKEVSPLFEEDKIHADFHSSRHGKKYAKDTADTFIFPDSITLHYHRDDKDYANKRFWMWSKSGAPEVEFLMEKEDDWSYQFTFNPAEIFNSKTDDSFSFMVKNTGTWGGKSAEIPILYKDYPPVKQADGSYKLDLYIIQVGTNLKIFKTKDDALSDQIDIAFISNNYKKINIYTTDGTNNGKSVIENLRIYKFNEYYDTLDDTLKLTLKPDYILFSQDNINKTNVAVEFSKTLSINCKYIVEASFYDKPGVYSTYTIAYDNLYNTPEFVDLNYNGDDLGATINFDESTGKYTTTFKVRAPTASSMGLKIYDRGYASSFLPKENYTNGLEKQLCDSFTYYDMKLNLQDAVWELTLDGNLEGKYYTYRVSNTYGVNEVVDPYAKSAGIKGQRGMVVDFNSDKAKPEKWDELPLVWDKEPGYDIKTTQELAISEVHIRDLTMDDSWNGPENLKGTFNGFIEKGTKYNGVTTGFDHLDEFGVNAIQLLPIFDQDNGERGFEDVALNPDKPEELTRVTDYNSLAEFNWGYNPLNYNVVEGAYSSDPRDGYARVKEFRNLVYQFGIKENHTRVIMDVVFNHVSSAPTSNFERLMPRYYFRFDSSGGYSDASGCGNEIKTEAPMMRKFISDSLYFWAKEYKIKGFRFDLMGAIDMETLSICADRLYKLDPDIAIYGEGWHAAAPSIAGDLIAVNNNIHKHLGPNRMDPSSKAKYKGEGYVGGFNNGIRDSLKGDNDINNDDAFRGFIGGDGNQTYRAKIGLVGGNGNGDHPMNPLQNINYVSCHDNFTLFDQLNWLLGNGTSDQKHKNPDLEPELKLVAQASATVNGAILMSNAISFINGGEEIFRTKIENLEDPNAQELTYETTMYGKRISHNSYKSDDAVNAYDYARKAELIEYFNQYKKLVELKKNLAYSQEVVDPNTYSSGKIAHIETGNTTEKSIGLYREGNNGKVYHVYITSDASRSFAASGKIIFNNVNYEQTSGTIKTKANYGLIIVEEVPSKE